MRSWGLPSTAQNGPSNGEPLYRGQRPPEAELHLEGGTATVVARGDSLDLGASEREEPPLQLGLLIKSWTLLSHGVCAIWARIAVFGELTPSLYSVLHQSSEPESTVWMASKPVRSYSSDGRWWSTRPAAGHAPVRRAGQRAVCGALHLRVRRLRWQRDGLQVAAGWSRRCCFTTPAHAVQARPPNFRDR